MAFFKTRKKKKFGTSSNIMTIRSPYLRNRWFNKKSGIKFKRRSKNIEPFSFPGRRKSKPKTGKQKIIISAILSIGIVLFGIHSLFLSDYLAIKNYKVIEEGLEITDNSRINELLKNTLEQNLLLFNAKELESKIHESHPEIDYLKIKKSYPVTLEVEYKKFPTASNIINIVDGIQKKFLADSQGFLIEENMELLDLPYIYIYGDQPLGVRQTILPDPLKSKEKFTYILSAMNIFEEKFGIKTLYAQFLPREREVHLYTEKYFYVMFDMEKPLLRQISKLNKSLPKLDIFNESLVYIDLRISGTDTEKVIYKRK